jgi:hypothetical protein
VSGGGLHRDRATISPRPAALMRTMFLLYVVVIAVGIVAFVIVGVTQG